MLCVVAPTKFCTKLSASFWCFLLLVHSVATYIHTFPLIDAKVRVRVVAGVVDSVIVFLAKQY
jgi:hypothetical protein